MSSWKENWVELYRTFIESDDFKQVHQRVKKGKRSFNIEGICGSLGALYIHALSVELNMPVVYVSRTREDAISMMRNLEFHALWNRKSDDEQLGIYHFHEDDSTSRDFQSLKDSEQIIDRYQVLEKLLYEKNSRIVTTSQALRIPIVSPNRFMTALVNVKVGSRWDIDDLMRRLREIGYQVVRTVRYAGEVALRGGILDVFAVGHEKPVRLDFFGEELDSIRIFDPTSQRSSETIQSVRISPCFEARSYDRERIEEAGIGPEKLEDIGGESPGAWDELTNSYFAQRDKNSLLDYIPENGLLILDGDDVLASLVDEEPEIIHENWVETDLDGVKCDDGSVQPQINLPFLEVDYIHKKISEHYCITFLLPSDETLKKEVISIRAIDISLDFGSLPNRIKHLVKQIPKPGGYLVTRSAKRIEQDYSEDLDAVSLIYGELFGGFLLPDAGIGIIGDEELFPNKIHPLTRHKRKSITQKELRMIHSGEYIVHVDYGVGIFKGIERSTVNSVTRDYILLEYAYGDKLFIPTDQLDQIFKYSSGEGNAPTIHKLGTTDWQRTKQKIKKALRKIAEELLILYHKRAKLEGYAFSPDQPWQGEIEDDFEFIETDGQERSIKEVKQDMESGKPMDRLVCGEVGYGKTELAVRAALKSVLDGRQVALLCPTTILAQQHFLTFLRRLDKLPLKVEMLSRFKSRAEQKVIIEQLAKGEVDIIIGTHRILSKDIVFAKLGLLIVDEEQKFGVRHKEQIKFIKTNVDVLTLTATPIPRTLYMSLVGLRDISFIDTPPPGRLPVKTFIRRYHDKLIADAINREIQREGQIYYLFNRVETIMAVYDRLTKLVPDARIAVGHGQMDKRKLEKSMLEFLSGEYDILLCTTIIENGLDIPRVNTLIVENAQNFGLAQLHQLRGRVGRSSVQAYSYFLYPNVGKLTSIGRQRLEALTTFSHLGAGYEIARRDLELRGAGNILGPEQHGFVGQVGLEMYCRLVDETILEIKKEEGYNEPKDVPFSGPAIDIPFSAHLPENYIPAIAERLDIYRRLGRIQNEEELVNLESELRDRFGKLPDVTKRLLEIVKLKNHLREIYVSAAHYNRDESKFNIIFEAGEPPLPWHNGKCIVAGKNLNKTQKGFWFRSTGDWDGLLNGVIELVDGILAKKFLTYANK